MRFGEHGFAYLWTLLLVAFMGIGLTVGAEVYSTSVRRDKEKELLFIGHQFRDAIGRYYEGLLQGGARVYPVTLDELLQDTRSPGARRYLRKRFVDPMTGKAEWGLVIIGGRIVGVHSLSEQEPIKVDNFEPADAAFRGKKKYYEWVFTYPADLMLHQNQSTPGGDPAKGQNAQAVGIAPFGAATSLVGGVPANGSPMAGTVPQQQNPINNDVPAPAGMAP